MIFDNVYINSFQLKNGLFPVKEGFLYSVDADGLPMCVVGERTSCLLYTSGCNDYLTKPLSAPLLKETIAKYLV